MMKQVYANPLMDPDFKILFGPEKGKKNMMNFLAALLPELQIVDIEYLNTEQTGQTVDFNKSDFDLYVQLQDGRRVVVEMQKANLQYFNYRSVYYSSHVIQIQGKKERDRQVQEMRRRGRRPCWNYYFDAVYVVGILQNGMGAAANVKTGDYIERYRILNTKTYEDMEVDLNFVYLRLDRFDKSDSQSRNPIDMFAWSMKNMSGLSGKPESFGDSPEMEEFYTVAYLAGMPAELRYRIEIQSTMTTENDWLVAMAEAEERAIERGLKKGMEQGLEQGLEKGLEQGRKEVAHSIAAKMKAKGIPADVISEISGLSSEEIESL